jgi:hypothetical protein
MKTIICFLLFIPTLLIGKVGPDLAMGVQTEYFTKLRFDYAKNPQTNFFPMWRLDPEHEALVKAYKESKPDDVLKIADSWLGKCPIDADSHLRVAMCCKEIGDLPSYNYHLAIFYGLLSSITSSGDGHTQESAFKVISVHEEYSLLQEIGAKLEKQTLLSGPCDKMEVSRRNGEKKFTLYFDVTIPIQALEDQMKKGPDKAM